MSVRQSCDSEPPGLLRKTPENSPKFQNVIFDKNDEYFDRISLHDELKRAE